MTADSKPTIPQTDVCPCRNLVLRSFRCIEEAVYGTEADEVFRRSELVEVDRARHTSLYACRTCATRWVEVCTSSGPMDLYHLVPVPDDVADARRWWQEIAKPLPLRRWVTPDQQP